MNRPIDPLDPEERALAERLSRLGPHDGPPAALDAKILAAAHAAAASDAKPARRRWWAALGVPPVLVTGVGTAAAAALVLGIAWQLRPTPSLVLERAAHDESALVVVEPQAPAPRREIAPPPPAAAAPDEAPAAAPAEAASDAMRVESRAARIAEAAPAAPSPPPPPVIAEPARRSPPRNDAEAVAGEFAPQAFPAAPEAAQAARGGAEASARSLAAAPDTADAAAADDTASLDQVQVTGTRSKRADVDADDRRRIADALRVPVRRDRQLAPDAWLQRIRDRRDGGREDDARASLQAFRRAHPSVEIPDDLRPLLR